MILLFLVADVVGRQFDDQRVDVRADQADQTAVSRRRRRGGPVRQNCGGLRRSADVQGGKPATPTADVAAKARDNRHRRQRRPVRRRRDAVHTEHVVVADTM